MEQIMKKINSNSAKQNDNILSGDAILETKNTQIVSNYDSHSEEKPHQTQTVNLDNHPDRSSGVNIDTSNENKELKNESCTANLDRIEEGLKNVGKRKK